MTKLLVIFATTAFLVGVGTAVAHEGHVHTVMGTVTAQHDRQLEIKTADGKIATVTINDATVVLRGAEKLTPRDIAAGQRVVVDVGDGKTPLVARQVKLGVVKAAAGTAKPEHDHH
jgi:hypothetical protein